MSIFKYESNVLVDFLKELGVKFTRRYATSLYEKHPNKYNLLGLSNMLSWFSVLNITIKGREKEECLESVSLPFVAYMENKFVVVKKIDQNLVYGLVKGEKVLFKKDDFLKQWSGVALLAEVNECSIEPGYNEHKRKENWIKGMIYASVFFVASLFIYNLIFKNYYECVSFWIFFAINLIGVVISVLIVERDFDSQYSYADKICNIFKLGTCGNVLNSKAAKLGGIWGWGEIGVSYFLSNIILIVFFSSLLMYYFLINIVSLPYTVWSVWYQINKARQWCVLCLIVQVILWVNFISFVFYYSITGLVLSVEDIFEVIFIYIVPFLILQNYFTALKFYHKMKEVEWKFNSLKIVPGVLDLLLNKDISFSLNRNASNILFGNQNAKHCLTFVTNPHCLPCAKVHEEIDGIFRFLQNEICIQYVFVSFNKSMDISCMYLIYKYLSVPDREEVKMIYSQWYKGDNEYKRKCVKECKNDFDGKVLQEYAIHKKWSEFSNYRFTPLILFDGRKLPEYYSLKDLLNLFHMKVPIIKNEN